MPRPKSDNTFQVAIKIPKAWILSASKIATKLSTPGMSDGTMSALRILAQKLRDEAAAIEREIQVYGYYKRTQNDLQPLSIHLMCQAATKIEEWIVASEQQVRDDAAICALADAIARDGTELQIKAARTILHGALTKTATKAGA